MGTQSTTSPPLPPKEAFAWRYKFVWPIILAVNLAVGDSWLEGLGRRDFISWIRVFYWYYVQHYTSRFRLTHETSFVRAHASFWTRIPVVFYIGCFFRQFYRSVRKADYLALRNGFIAVHLASGSKFNFQKHIKRSLEDDFKVVVGISPILWASFIIFLLINVDGWHTMMWASVIPLFVVYLFMRTKKKDTGVEEEVATSVPTKDATTHFGRKKEGQAQRSRRKNRFIGL